MLASTVSKALALCCLICLVAAQNVPPLGATSPAAGQAATNVQTTSDVLGASALNAATFVGTDAQNTFLSSYADNGAGGGAGGTLGATTELNGAAAGNTNPQSGTTIAQSTVLQTTTTTPVVTSTAMNSQSGGGNQGDAANSSIFITRSGAQRKGAQVAGLFLSLLGGMTYVVAI